MDPITIRALSRIKIYGSYAAAILITVIIIYCLGSYFYNSDPQKIDRCVDRVIDFAIDGAIFFVINAFRKK
jgi:hypothetical protein